MDSVKKIVIFIIILGLFGGSFVFWIHQASADWMYFLKEFIIKPLVRQLANALENKLVNSITSLVSGLSQKVPSFITNWRNYTLDSQARGNDIFRSVLADATLCPYFKDNLQTAFGADKYKGTLSGASVKVGSITVYQNKTSIPGLPSFQNLTKCTLPADLNINTFRTDFAKGGGWDTWNKLIQPQNNFFGAYSLALGEQTKQIQTENQSARDVSIAGQGFMGQKLDIDKSKKTSPSGCTGSTLASGAGRCIWFGKEVTPPKFLGDLSVKSLETKIGRVGTGQEITDVIFNLLSAVVNALGNRILNFAGLSGYNVPPSYSSGFDEAGAEITPDPSLSNPSYVCEQGCDSEYNDCASRARYDVCTTNPNPPPAETCQSQPDQGELDKCSAARNSCINSCSQIP
jgi:hypothetical protein